MVVRGTGTLISICETVTLGESEYLPDKGEVRHVVTRSEDGPVEWTAEPVARYAHRECVKTGAGAVIQVIEDRYDSPIETITTKAQFDDDGESGERILVEYTVWKEPEEQLVTSPSNIDFDDLVAVTPQTVQSTVELVDKEYSRDVPVFLRRTEAAFL